MLQPFDPREPAINENSCFLACIVSLLRDHGVQQSQTQMLATPDYQNAFPRWATEAGALTLGEGSTLAMTLLGAEAYVVAHTKRKALECWQQPERLGAFVVTTKTVRNGVIVEGIHAWRILNCDEDKLFLMNPTQTQAEIRPHKWNFLDLMNGRIVLIESGGYQASVGSPHSIPNNPISSQWGS